MNINLLDKYVLRLIETRAGENILIFFAYGYDGNGNRPRFVYHDSELLHEEEQTAMRMPELYQENLIEKKGIKRSKIE